jgi:hypothetical protein
LDSQILTILIFAGLFLLILAKFTISTIMHIFKCYEQGLHFHYPAPYHHVIIEFQDI